MTFEFCAVLNELYRDGAAADETGTIRAAEGLSTRNNILMLRALMMKLKPARTIEVGLAAGGSALTFAASHRDLGGLPQRQHVAIDPYQRIWHHLGKILIARAGLSDYVEIIEEPSRLALPDKLRKGESFQLAYIDGSHVFHEALLDFYYVRHLLAMGGVVVFDDCATPDLRQLIKFIRKRIVSFEEFDLTPFRHDGGGLRYRFARSLGRVQCVAFRKVKAPQEDETGRNAALNSHETCEICDRAVIHDARARAYLEAGNPQEAQWNTEQAEAIRAHHPEARRISTLSLAATKPSQDSSR